MVEEHIEDENLLSELTHTTDEDEDDDQEEEDEDAAFSEKNQQERVRMFFRLLAVCHTVVVQSTDGKIGGIKPSSEDDVVSFSDLKYQAASPDESALVTAARRLGFQLCHRDKLNITIQVLGRTEVWEVLNILEFNSDRKRM
eukprot:TRINITY_DN22128_c0_g1_i1.p1 TRINITY_DN22128_c0_g1~~TRINITY_DN22128_c0_g1_i1.p1  ORF type:complete len:161 (+),score=43.17 TRINITY_DN22128_c0_g1_i1:60-485(+)